MNEEKLNHKQEKNGIRECPVGSRIPLEPLDRSRFLDTNDNIYTTVGC